MCDVAKDCGVKIIADIVANHVVKNMEEVSSGIKTIPDAFCGMGGLPNNSDRFEITHCDLLGFRSLNVNNKKIREIITKYMNDCLDCGA